MSIILDCKLIANDILNKLKKENIQYQIEKPVLVVFSTNNPTSIYILNLIKQCNLFSIKVILKSFNRGTTEKNFLLEIKKANEDININAILIEMPLLKNWNKYLILSAINPEKDVDCLNFINQSRILNKNYQIVPAVCEAILILLNYYKINLSHKTVTIIGRSTHLSWPLAILLSANECTISICHRNTINLEKIIFNSDIVINATNTINLLTNTLINCNQIIINLNDKDTNFNSLIKNSKAISMVPHGIGLLSIACLIKNIYQLYNEQNRHS